MQQLNTQFQAIQSMMTSGHRCVHLERHSLLLIGGTGGFLSVVTEWVITGQFFPDTSQRALALLLWLGFWFGGASLLDNWLTRRARERRAETLPFAQAQITRAWWMLLAMGCLGTFAMAFYGGGAMVYALWIVLLGLGIYLFGLFSRPLIEWIGLATILLGVLGLAAGLPYGATRWLAAASFAIGMPLAGWLNDYVGDAGVPRRIAALVVWLTLVVTPSLLIPRLVSTEPPDAAPITVAAVTGVGEQVVRLEAGDRIPLRVDLTSPLLSIPSGADLDMTLNMPVEVVLQDGDPDGRYRIGKGEWREIRDGLLQLRIDNIKAHLASGRAEVRTRARIDSEDLE